MLLSYLPQSRSQCIGWNVKTKYELEPAEEGLVYVVNDVGSEDYDSRKAFNVIKQDAHVHIGITIGRSATNGTWIHKCGMTLQTQR